MGENGHSNDGSLIGGHIIPLNNYRIVTDESLARGVMEVHPHEVRVHPDDYETLKKRLETAKWP